VFWNKKKTWPIDPAMVEYGSVTPRASSPFRPIRKDSTEQKIYVEVRYRGERRAQCLPATVFVARTSIALRAHQSLHIEHLRVSPRTKRRYAVLFDRLTDWRPATRKALGGTPRGRARSERNGYVLEV
jgi:hypothetical protein